MIELCGDEIMGKYIPIITEEEVRELLAKRLLYRKENNFLEADKIRAYLVDKGVIIQDIKDASYFFLSGRMVYRE